MDLQETGVLKYQDPFVVIETTRARLETAVAKGAGSDPEWKEAFELMIASGTAPLRPASQHSKLRCVCSVCKTQKTTENRSRTLSELHHDAS